MKTKILGIVTIVTLVLMMLVSSVNAADFTADKTEMKKGDIVTLTVTTDNNVESAQFDISFDTKYYSYVENSASSSLTTGSNVIRDGVVRVSALSITGDTTNTITLQFKALENGEAIPFTISNTEFGLGVDEVQESFKNTTLNVTIADPAPVDPEEPTDPEEPVDPEDPTDPQEPANPDDNKDEENGSKDESNSGEYVDENGNAITKLPQTGSLVPAIAVGIVIIAGIALVVFKAIKK